MASKFKWHKKSVNQTVKKLRFFPSSYVQR